MKASAVLTSIRACGFWMWRPAAAPSASPLRAAARR